MVDPMDPALQPQQGTSPDAWNEHGVQLGSFEETELEEAPLIDVEARLEKSEAWHADERRLQRAISTAYLEAASSMAHMQEHVNNYWEYLGVDVPARVSAACDQNRVRDVGEMLDRYKANTAALQDMSDTMRLRLVEVHISKVRDELADAPSRLLAAMQRAIPEEVHARGNAILDWVSNRRQQLSMAPNCIDAFVEQLTVLEEINLESRVHERSLNRIAELSEIGDTYGVGAGQGRMVQKVVRERLDFRQWCGSKEQDLTRVKSRFVTELAGRAEELLETSRSLAEDVGSADFLELVTEEGSFGAADRPPSEQLAQAGKLPRLFCAEPRVGEFLGDIEAKYMRLEKLRDRQAELSKLLAACNRYEVLLAVDSTVSPELDQALPILEACWQLWGAARTWVKDVVGWMRSELGSLDVETIKANIATLATTAIRVQDVLGETPISEELRCHFASFQECLPVLASLQNPHFRECHWSAIAELMHTQELAGASVGLLLELGASSRAADVQAVSMRATQERFVEVTLQRLAELWAGVELTVEVQREARDAPLLGATERVEELLEDSLVSIDSALASRYARLHLDEARNWHRRLSIARNLLQEWIACQRKYVHLERIFCVSQRQLISESVAFQRVDEGWRRIMDDLEANPNFMAATQFPGIADTLRDYNESLDSIQHDLNDYIDMKRMAFPRLYFVSSDELLKMLASSRDLGAVEQQIRLCFPGVHALEFDERSADVHGMISEFGECLSLPRIKIRSYIEETLELIQQAMLTALQRALLASLSDATKDSNFAVWATNLAHPAQASLLAARITWCCHVEAYLTTSGEVSPDHPDTSPQASDGPAAWSARRRSSCGIMGIEVQQSTSRNVSGRGTLLRVQSAPTVYHSMQLASPIDFAGLQEWHQKSRLAPLLQCIRELQDSRGGDVSSSRSAARASTRRPPAAANTTSAAAPLRSSLSELILAEVHSRDVLAALAKVAQEGFGSLGGGIPSDAGDTQGPSRVAATQSFEWQRQLRYYYDLPSDAAVLQDGAAAMSPGDVMSPNSTLAIGGALGGGSACVTVRQMGVNFNYGFEYSGGSSRFVVTPLTERCYIAVTQAAQLQLGTAVHGPAGVGKTETLKNLAAAVGTMCTVFRCVGQVSPWMTAQVISGVAQQGCWAILDEVDKVDNEILSAVAQQVSQLQQAIRAGSESIEFEGAIIPVKLSGNICLTRKPACAGEAELPFALRSYFRSISVVTPDYARIAEALLCAEGFFAAFSLSRKAIAFLDIMKHHHSTGSPCDFGLRALSGALELAGELRRQLPADVLPRGRKSGSKTETEAEESVVANALLKTFGPQFCGSADTPVMQSIIADIFHSRALASENTFGRPKQLGKDVKVACQALGLSPLDEFVDKLMELHEAHRCFQGLFVLGPAGAGKTAMLRVLAKLRAGELKRERGLNLEDAEAMGRTGWPLGVDILNPKSVSLGELVGSPNSQGLLPTVLRNHEATPRGYQDSSSGGLNWLIFDGPVDSEWADCMASLLDSDRAFRPPGSGSLLVSQDLCTFFECDDIGSASPAIVTRCGIVRKVGVSSAIDALTCSLTSLGNARKLWIPQSAWDYLLQLVDLHVPALLEYVRGGHSGTEAPPPQSDMQLTENFASILCVTLARDPFVDKPLTPLALHGIQKLDQGARQRSGVVECLQSDFDYNRYMLACFTFSLVWGFGSAASRRAQLQLGAWCSKHISDLILPERMSRKRAGDPVPRTSAACKTQGSADIFDLMVDWNAPPYFLSLWDDALPDAASLFASNEPLSHLIVPTVAMAQCTWLAFTRSQMQRHTLLIGPTGTGKTVTGTVMLRRAQNHQNWTFIDLALSRTISAERVQGIVEPQLQKKRQMSLGAPDGTLAMLFVEDVSMPIANAAGAREPLELLRQVVDYEGGMYDRKSWQWRNVVETAILATSSHVAAVDGGACLPARFLRHFHIISLSEPSRESLRDVFGTLLIQFFSSKDIGAEVANLGATFCDATLEVLHVSREIFGRTPSTFFDSFSVRDVMRVVHGVLAVRPDSRSLQSKPEVAMLWTHECTRVFADRFASESEKEQLANILDGIMRAHFKVSVKNDPNFMPPMYGDFLLTGIEAGKYEDMHDEDRLKTFLTEQLHTYNSQISHSAPRLSMVFFPEAIMHLSRILRACRLPRGHMMLIGTSGCGRKTLCTLAAFIMDMRRFSFEAGGNEGAAASFRALLKDVMRSTGVQSVTSMFQITCDETSEVGIFDDLHTLLNMGQIPSLWNDQEPEAIQREVLLAMAGENNAFVGTTNHGFESPVDGAQKVQQQQQQLAGGMKEAEVAWRLFLSRVRDQLRFVLGCSPVGGQLRQRCLHSPALLNCCTLDYYQPWPDKALMMIGSTYLGDPVNLERCLTVDTPSTSRLGDQCIVAAAVKAYNAARLEATESADVDHRQVFITPRCFIEQCALAKAHMVSRCHELERSHQKLSDGLAQLRVSYEHAQELERVLVDAEPALLDKANNSTAMAEECVRFEAERAQIEAQLKDCQEVVAARGEEVERLRADCQQTLSGAMPELKAAMKAIEKLDKKDILELRSLSSPPPLCTAVMDCVCLLLGYKSDWSTAKNVLADANFLKRLKEFDKDAIPEKVATKLKANVRKDNFDVSQVDKQCQAAKALWLWCCALNTYCDVAKDVEPKKVLVAEAEARRDAAQTSMADVEKQLEFINSRISNLEAERAGFLEEMEQLQAKRDQSLRQKDVAKALLHALEGKRELWAERCAAYSAELASLPGHTLVAAACVAYSGPFPKSRREALLTSWVQHFDAAGAFGAEGIEHDALWQWPECLQLSSRLSEGLADENLTTSALIASRALRWPLCLDPHGQAQRWLRKCVCSSAPQHTLRVESADSPTLESVLKLCAEDGLPLLVVGCGTSFSNALRASLVRPAPIPGAPPASKNRWPQDDGFALYLTVDHLNPVLSAQVSAMVSVVDFAINIDGLTEELLKMLLRMGQPESVERRIALLQGIERGKEEFATHEETLLGLLGEASDNILDDSDLVEQLGSAAKSASVVSVKMQRAEESLRTLQGRSTDLRLIAHRAALAYFVVASSASICSAYVVSLSSVYRLFENAAEKHEFHEGEDNSSCSDSIACSVLFGLTGGFLREHRLAVAVHYCMALGCSLGTISECQKRLFVHGPDTLEDASLRQKSPDPLCFPDETWRTLMAMALLEPAFAELPVHIAENIEAWRSAAAAENPNVAVALGLSKDGTPEDSRNASKSSQRAPSKQLLRPGLARANSQNVAAMSRMSIQEDLSIKRKTFALGTGERMRLRGRSTSKMEAEDENSDVAETTPSLCKGLPAPWGKSGGLSTFNQLLLVKALQPSRLLKALQQFVVQTPGMEAFDANAPPEIADALAVSTCRTPILVLLGQGADAPAEVLKLAEKQQQQAGHVHVAALCGETAGRSMHMIKECAVHGQWVLLDLCHVSGPSLLPRFAQFVAESIEYAGNTVSDDFRLFLLSRPALNVPARLIRSCVLTTCEPPRGLHATLRRSTEDFIQRWEDRSERPCFEQLLVAMSLFHAAVRTRGRLGLLGLSTTYDFSTADRDCSMASVLHLLNTDVQSGSSDGEAELPWKALNHMIVDVHYGGRAITDTDRRWVASMFRRFVCLREGSQTEACSFDARTGRFTLDQSVAAEGFKALDAYEDWDLYGLDYQTGSSMVRAELDDCINLLRELSSGTSTASAPDAVSHAAFSNASLIAQGQAVARELLQRVPSSRGAPDPPQKRLGEEGILGREASYPLALFLHRELSCLHLLLTTVRSTLDTIRLAANGEMELSETSDADTLCLAASRLPEAWRWAYPSQLPLASWALDLRKRAEFLWSWQHHAASDAGYVPRCVWLGGCFSPRAFLAGVRQRHARASGEKLDGVEFSFGVHLTAVEAEKVRELPPASTGAVYMHGMYLQGARWDVHNRRLEDSRPCVSLAIMPVIVFGPATYMAQPEARMVRERHQQRQLGRPIRSRSKFGTAVSVQSIYEHDAYLEDGASVIATSSVGVAAAALGVDSGSPRSSVPQIDGSDAGGSIMDVRGSLKEPVRFAPVVENFTTGRRLSASSAPTGTVYSCPLYRVAAPSLRARRAADASAAPRRSADDSAAKASESRTLAAPHAEANAFVAMVDLPTAITPQEWVLRGVSLSLEPPGN
eukprot:TRINITY_DN19515_c0_g4_i1.p1 TRINITY_DN19515_c0_g4~~TRINITY_DN19515_c0_g4_i1.p1  ORF type:complete len:4480 (+),score=830.82 TRINITY_DN19515_c0_g4_i1:968-13441(+)